jgi:gluconolactonase
MLTLISAVFLAGSLPGCQPAPEPESETRQPAVTPPTTGLIERYHPDLDRLIDTAARLEVLAEGFEWSEGPVWVASREMLLFSDVPKNIVYQWTESGGLKPYLEPSGYTGTAPRGGEPGANGLTLDPDGKLALCQHGDRRVARMEAPLEAPAPGFTTLAGEWNGKRLNSPNDLTFVNGSLYFTDPPYGLANGPDDPDREIAFQGVYQVKPGGEVVLLVDSLSRPNGIAFTPDGRRAYVANSDPERAVWIAYDVDDGGAFANGRVFFDATSRTATEKGLPDGLKVHSGGALFATGPGGVLVFSEKGEELGLIRTGEATANCAFDEGQRHLYITADGFLMRLALKH